jgi:flavin-dependent dehydrogenase
MKTAIIGAGINGLYLSWKLSQLGHEVAVFEKKEKIGKTTCSGLFSERILEFVPQGEKLIQNKINSVLIHFPKKTFNIGFSKKILVINHFELDNLAADLARRAGVKIFLDNFINDIPQGFDRVIGCDGPNSIIRKKLGLKEPSYRLAVQGFTSKEDYSSCVETWPISNGFIWKVPRGKETEYGVIGNPKEVKPLFEGFLSENNLKLEKLESALVPQGFLVPSDPKITLCGDAAGLTKPWSGGGVIWGLTAADFLLKNFPDFIKYKIAAKKFFLPKITVSKIAVKVFYFFGFRMPWFLPKNLKIESDFLLWKKYQII